MFTGLSSTGSYMFQIWSLSSSPIGSFTTTHRIELKNLIVGLLYNPYFYGFIALIVIMSILPTVDDD